VVSSLRRRIIEVYAMRRLFTLTAAVLTLVALTPNLALAQALPKPPVVLQPSRPLAPIKPYLPVTVTLPPLLKDPSFIAFRKTLSDIAQHKDRAALAKLIVGKGFFWLQDEHPLADPNKSGIDNLAEAIDLDAKNGTGWDTLAEVAAEPSAAEAPQRNGIFCAPAVPGFDPQAFAKLLQATGTVVTEWGFPIDIGAEVRATAKPDAQVIEKMSLYLVRVLAENVLADAIGASLQVVLPTGKTGYVSAAAVVPLATDQICYVKGASDWMITGCVSGGRP